MAKKKGLASKVFGKAHEGRLTKFGWPDADKLIAAAKAGHRKEVSSGLNVLANFAADDATKAKAKAILNRIKALDKEGS